MLKKKIDAFLAEKRIGIAGVSRNAAKFSNKVYEKLKESGYELHPIHPQMQSLGNDKCVANVKELPADAQALIVIASPDVTTEVLSDIPANIKQVWVFCGPGSKSNVTAQIERLKSNGVSVISGFCPFMFLEPVGSVHSIHRFFVRLFGKYPK